MKTPFISRIQHSAIAALMLGLTACSDNIDTPFTPAGPDAQPGRISFSCGDMLEVYKGADNYASRAGASKNPEEKAIKTLHVFFFSVTDGHLLTAVDYDNFDSYQKKINESFITIPDAQLFTENPTDVRVVAVANIDATDEATDATDPKNAFYVPGTKAGSVGLIQRAGRDKGGEPHPVTSYADLEKWVYYPRIRMSDDGERGDISKLPVAGMPMIGEAVINLTDKTANKPVNLVAMMAKVNISVELDPDDGYHTQDKQLPMLTINEYGVKNMPVGVPFKARTGKPKGGSTSFKKVSTFQDYIDTYDVTSERLYHNDGSICPDDRYFDVTEADYSSDVHEYTTSAGLPVTINMDSEPVTFSYYTYENVNLPDYNAIRANGTAAFPGTLTGDSDRGIFPIPTYPDGVSEKEYQRWKSTIAYENCASALILKGEYTTHQGLRYQAQFTIYLGNDTDRDFMVKRNHRYDNNIKIKGLDYIRNTTDDVYTFDGRVNVKADNSLYIAIVNERMVDAHASALPMDIWLMDREAPDAASPKPTVDYYTDVTVTIPPAARSWVQMVAVPREEMENHSTGRFLAGTACEPYFYYYMITDIANNPDAVLGGSLMGSTVGYPGHHRNATDPLCGAQCGPSITMRSTPGADGGAVNNSRARVYFYIDENTAAADSLGSTDRTVKVNVLYKCYRLNGADTILVEPERYRTIDIEQKGLRRVRSQWVADQPNNNNRYETATIAETYIEYFEEYLDHDDPLEEHLSGEKYDGLEWGLNGVNVDGSNGFNNPESGNSYYQVYYKQGAYAMTQWAVGRQPGSIADVRLFNADNKPASAFHYCYGKNKRGYDGDVAPEAISGNKGWYMPGIRELETALVQYYNIFRDEFRGNYYWSASCARSHYILFQGQTYDSNYTHARATQVKITNGRVSYVSSGTSDDAGFKPRINTGPDDTSATLRIRAFYRRN